MNTKTISDSGSVHVIFQGTIISGQHTALRDRVVTKGQGRGNSPGYYKFELRLP